jgi:two-component system, response regulator PdtaR
MATGDKESVYSYSLYGMRHSLCRIAPRLERPGGAGWESDRCFAEPHPPCCPYPSMNTKTVVVAEDESVIRLLVADAMTDAGFNVLEAGHAEEALHHLQTQFATIHLLFTDIHMPGEMTGLALAHYVQETWPHIALLIASGELPAKELPAGSLFLTKPYETRRAVAHARALTGG